MPDFPWYIPNLSDGKIVGYAGPLAGTAARDAYTAAYDGPDTLGTPFQSASTPTLPHVTAIVAASEGDKLVWSDGNITDA